MAASLSRGAVGLCPSISRWLSAEGSPQLHLPCAFPAWLLGSKPARERVLARKMLLCDGITHIPSLGCVLMVRVDSQPPPHHYSRGGVYPGGREHGCCLTAGQPLPSHTSVLVCLLKRRNKFPHASPEKCITDRTPCGQVAMCQTVHSVNKFAVLETWMGSFPSGRLKQGRK